jgi:PAS domain-containing protein
MGQAKRYHTGSAIFRMPIRTAVQATREKKHDGRDLDGIVTSWNTSAERMYGYTRAEVIGKSDSMLAPVDRPDDIHVSWRGYDVASRSIGAKPKPHCGEREVWFLANRQSRN